MTLLSNFKVINVSVGRSTIYPKIYKLYQFRLRLNDIEDTAVPFPYPDQL